MGNLIMQFTMEAYAASLIAFILGCGIAIIGAQMINKAKTKTFEQDLQRQIDGATKEAENIVKAAQVEASAETIRRKEEFTVEVNRIRAEMHETEVRINKREDILAYLKARKCSYVTDSSNFFTGYLRNEIRLNVMPGLLKIWMRCCLPMSRESAAIPRPWNTMRSRPTW